MAASPVDPGAGGGEEHVALPDLNFPKYNFAIRDTGRGREIFDNVRERFVVLTPEEWVRQHLVRFLIEERGYPRGLVVLEHAFVFEGRGRRADIVAFGRRAQPLVMAECKATSVELSQAVFDQIAAYNASVGAKMLVVSNGLRHYCYEVDDEGADGRFTFVSDVPPFSDLSSRG